MHGGKFWVKNTDLNYRQSSGVEFRGEYVDAKKYLQSLKHRNAPQGECDEDTPR